MNKQTGHKTPMNSCTDQPVHTKRLGMPVLLLFMVIGLSACGNKGDLYLPEEPTENSAPAQEPVEQESSESGIESIH